MKKQQKLDENLDELEQLSGEAGIKQAPKLEFPTVRLDGRAGMFLKYTNANGQPEKEDLGKELSGVMLKVRRTFSEFSKQYRLFTNEHNSWKDRVILFESKKTQKGNSIQMVDEGLIKDLRERHPMLRMRQIIYFMLEPSHEIVKLVVKGKGLSNLFDYWKDFATTDHMFQFITDLKVKEETGELGSYFSVDFSKGEVISDITEVAEKIRDISAKVKKVEDYYASQTYTPEDMAEKVEGDIQKQVEDTSRKISDSEIPIIEEGVVDDDGEIEVADIPL